MKKNVVMIVVSIILVIIWIFIVVIVSLFIKKLTYYKKNCPFMLSDELNEHYKRRCELYNIYENSRYRNQYICSYDPTKDFKYKVVRNYRFSYREEKRIKRKIENDFLVCVDFTKEIDNNPIITSFCNEYSNSKKFYCSRTNQPKKLINVDDKNCKNNHKFIGIIVIYVILFLELFYYFFIFFYSFRKLDYFDSSSYFYRKNKKVKANKANKENKEDYDREITISPIVEQKNVFNNNVLDNQKEKTIKVGFDNTREVTIKQNIKTTPNVQKNNDNNN